MASDEDWARAVDIQEGLTKVQIESQINYSNPTLPLTGLDQNSLNQNGSQAAHATEQTSQVKIMNQ